MFAALSENRQSLGGRITVIIYNQHHCHLDCSTCKGFFPTVLAGCHHLALQSSCEQAYPIEIRCLHVV